MVRAVVRWMGMSELLSCLTPYAGKPVLLALSGGCDSVGLLRAALQAGLEVQAAHFNHQLRPTALRDQRFVEDLCQGLNVPLQVGTAPVEAISRQKGLGIEATARQLRYVFLTRVARQQKTQFIFTAHTLQDQAETVLWQLVRGTAKATGIPAVRGRIHRPWLGVSRPDIALYLKGLDQPWQEDETNQDLAYTRNFLRHQVMPLLRQLNPRADEALARFAQYSQQDEAFLQQEARRVTPYASWSMEPLPIQRRLLVNHLQHLGIEPDQQQLEKLLQALQADHVQHLTLPGNHQITLQQGRPVAPQVFKPPTFQHPAHWTLRHRQPGDRISLPGGTRKLSDVLTDLRVPRDQRDQVWLLAEGQQVHWVGTHPPVVSRGFDQPVPLTDAHFMGLALQEARKALAADEVPIGAVLVHQEQVIAAAHNTCVAQQDLTRHAELEAIRQAGKTRNGHLEGCTLYVTLEPCPMCLGAMLESRISRIVFGARNPKMGALGGVQDLLRSHWGHTPQVQGGVLQKQCAALLTGYFAGKRTARPLKEEPQ